MITLLATLLCGGKYECSIFHFCDFVLKLIFHIKHNDDQEKGVPVLIFSAGLADIIEEVGKVKCSLIFYAFIQIQFNM